LLLPRNGFVDIAVALEPDQPRDAIALREARADAGSLLFNAQGQIASDADAELAVCVAGEHVDRIALIHAVSTVQATSVSFPARQKRGKGSHNAPKQRIPFPARAAPPGRTANANPSVIICAKANYL
jgi:hypothetical protein